MTSPQTTEPTDELSRPASSRLRSVLELVIAVGAVVAAVYIGNHLIGTGPRTEPRRGAAGKRAILVKTTVATKAQTPTQIGAGGQVVAARPLELRPEVSGQVQWVSPKLVPGAIVNANETLVRIDPANYQVAVRQAEAALAEAKANEQLERGNQQVAREELALIKDEVSSQDRALVLREPQLASAVAKVQAAEAALDKARIDLARTRVSVPFAATVRSVVVTEGSMVGEQSGLATVAGIDEWWIEIAVPRGQLRWIDVGGDTTATIVDEAAWPTGKTRSGRVIQIAADVESDGRLAKVLVAVADPLARRSENADEPKLLLGAWVKVTIDGKQLEDAIALDRDLLREGDTVWVKTKESTLDIRRVEVAFRERDRVFVSSGLEAGEDIVVTNLSNPAQAMPLRTEGAEEEAAPDGATGTN